MYVMRNPSMDEWIGLLIKKERRMKLRWGEVMTRGCLSGAKVTEDSKLAYRTTRDGWGGTCILMGLSHTVTSPIGFNASRAFCQNYVENKSFHL